jgi:protein ImuA
MASTAVARGVVCTLRQKIAKIEGRLAEPLETSGAPREKGFVRAAHGLLLRSGAARFDEALGGGVPASGLTEIHGAATRDAGAATGFGLGLLRLQHDSSPDRPLLWIGTSDVFREAGRPYAPGLAERFGFAAENLLTAEAAKLSDALWIAEEAARLDSFQAVFLEIRGSPHRRALIAGHPLFLLREAGGPEPTAAPVRLVVKPAQAMERVTLAGPLNGSIGPPAFTVAISKSRTSIQTAFTLEWTHDAFTERREAKDHLAVVSAPSVGPSAQATARQVVAFPQSQERDAAGVQPAGEQHAAHRRARRAG